jgi:phage terminase small subunit
MTDSQLTPKQAAFVREYLIDLNGAAAAVRAGYSPNAAKEQAARLLTHANVQAAIATAQAERSERTRVKADAVVEELRRIAFANISDYVAWNHEKVIFLNSQRMTPEALSAVAQVSYDKNGGVQVKLHDKIAALDKLMKHLGKYAPERHEMSGPGGKPIETKSAGSDLDYSKLSVEELMQLEAMMIKAGASE